MRLAYQFQGQKVRGQGHQAQSRWHTSWAISFEWQGLRTSELGIRIEDDDPHQRQAPWPPRLKVKVARSRDQSEPSCPNAAPVSLEAGGGIPCRPNLVATLLVTSARVEVMQSGQFVGLSCLSVFLWAGLLQK